MWGGLDNEFKFHLVNWKNVRTLHCGGLGIKSLLTFNQAILRKWLWMFAGERERERVSLWKHIRRGWDIFSSFVTVEVDDDS